MIRFVETAQNCEKRFRFMENCSDVWKTVQMYGKVFRRVDNWSDEWTTSEEN